MNQIKFALAIVTVLFVMVLLASAQQSMTREAGNHHAGKSPAVASAAERASAQGFHAAESVDVDVLELIENPSVQRSPLSVHAEQVRQGRGTALPLALDAQQYERIRFEQVLELESFPLPAARRGEDVRSVTLHLERIPVITDETVFVLGDVNAPDGVGMHLPTPDVSMYRGTVEGEPDSRVFLSLTPETAYGYIRSEGQTHLISPGPHGQGHDLLIYNLTAMPAGAIPWRDFVCSTAEQVVDLAGERGEAIMTAGEEEPQCRRVKLAIETDVEFTDNLFLGNETAAGVYVATMVGATSEIFLNNINSFFELSFVRLWTGEDIWSGGSTFAQLMEFQNFWNENMTHIQRDVAHFLSGRALGGGIAYLNAVCQSSFGYAVSANLNGTFPYPLEDNNAQNWDIMVFAHELGHNFGAPHTHNVCPQPLDECPPEAWFGQCQSEQNCITDGTIMSYCHLCPGGLTNIVLEFHPTIRNIMLDFLDDVDGPGCPLSTGRTTCAFGDTCEWVDLDGGTNNTVWAISEYNNDLIVGGDFTTAGGQTSQRIARWDDNQWHFIGAANNTVRALHQYNGEVVAGGLFTFIGGQVASRIARWNGISWSPLGDGLGGGSNPRVFDLAVLDGDLYVAGTFLTGGGETVNRIARWDGSAWHPLGDGVNNNVYALAVYDGELYAAGSFTTAGGDAAHRIARWDGEAWHPLGTGMNDIVFVLDVYDGDLIAGGQFTAAGSAPASRIARWDGSAWHALGDGVNGLVQALAVFEDRLYVGGTFALAGSVITSRMAEWDGEAWSGAAVGVNDGVRVIKPYQDGLAVGGSFTFVSGLQVNRIALVECDPDECAHADLNCDGAVNALDLLILLSAWGDCADPTDCPADLNNDGTVNALDLLDLLAHWG